jgi:O-antigen/teichoic acid export membrane protein
MNKKDAISGFLWTFFQQFGSQLIAFLTSLVLARFLNPSDFGTIAMVVVFILIGNVLIEFGLSQSIIRSKDIDDIALNSIFFFQLCVALTLCFMMFLVAPYISSFYKIDALVLIIRMYSFSFLMTAFVSVPMTVLTKNMQFKAQVVAMIPAVVISGAVAIYLSMNSYGIWSLLTMTLLQQFINTAIIWFMSEWKPGIEISFEKLKTHLNFGYKLVLSGIIDTVFTNIYTLLIGKNYSPSIVGYYNRADTLKQLPVANLSVALNKVTLPLFASIENEPHRLKSIYEKILKLVVFCLAPTLVIAMVVAEPLFRFLFTEKWLPSVPYFQILCLTGILYPIHSYNLNILNIKGRSDLFLKLEIIKKAIGILTIIIGLKYGIYGLLYSQVAMSFIAFFINSFYSGRLIAYNSLQQIRDILPFLFLSGFMGLFLKVGDYYIFSAMLDLVRISTVCVVGILFYLITSKILKFDVLTYLSFIRK